jgi:hypothetical protein
MRGFIVEGLALLIQTNRRKLGFVFQPPSLLGSRDSSKVPLARPLLYPKCKRYIAAKMAEITPILQSPNGIDVLAWSEDCMIAICAQDSVHVLVAQIF